MPSIERVACSPRSRLVTVDVFVVCGNIPDARVSVRFPPGAGEGGGGSGTMGGLSIPVNRIVGLCGGLLQVRHVSIRLVFERYLLTHSLTPCSRALLEKLTGSRLVKKFPAICETRRFITSFTSARHLSVS